MTVQPQAATTPGQPHSRAKSRLPGEEGVWFFILGDLLVFTVFFATFLYYRNEDVVLFITSQAQLNQGIGVLNTLLMLSSSWFVATAVHCVRLGLYRTSWKLLLLAFVCGAGFIVIKFFEYSEKITAGITLSTNDFFMYYFIYTGIHGIHVLIGLGILLYMTLLLRSRQSGLTASDLQNLESGAIFWHLVDLLWIVIFALLYLVK
ncbi:cytochrome c oxidase subunit 3 family protein [Halioglobus maricola]|uniref:Cytochrome c oxidase subunit 3 family protein n=1 Tax=Halioglobus maricola TaxID=2601894 RepID=A0A5P9NQP4_9GAMM|nr:cytochrome c oxidase subunit 3 family protein [Halioglobus maricola]QFU77198.1 cytochrome c oxidase subunit 3 family protein [Halioglobus maricola]